MSDEIDSPPHYRQLDVECIDVAEHFNYCMGNALKYIWRADFKGKPIGDLQKARWYIDREIKRRQKTVCDSPKNEEGHSGNMVGGLGDVYSVALDEWFDSKYGGNNE